MSKVLIKDLVIPAGTKFSDDDEDGKVSCIFGCSKDTWGEIVYWFDDSTDDKDKQELAKYFVDLKD